MTSWSSLFHGLGGDGVPHLSYTTLSTVDEVAQEAAQALLHDENHPKDAHDEDEEEDDDESASTQAHAEIVGVRRDGENEGASCASTEVYGEHQPERPNAEHATETSDGHAHHNKEVDDEETETGPRRSTRNKQPSSKHKDMVFLEAMKKEEKRNSLMNHSH